MLTDATQTSAPRRRGRPWKADVVVKVEVVKPRRKLSAKARKAIADAQRKRWAAKKGATSAPAKTEKKAAAKES